MIWIVVGLAGLPFFLLLMGSLHRKAFSAGWELLLTPHGAGLYRQMKEQLEGDLDLYDATRARAARLRELGSVDEALRLMRAGCTFIEQATPDRVRQLAGMALMGRLVAALAPVPPLRPRQFGLRQLATAAGAGLALHHFLVGAAERLRLRLLVLRYGFRLIGRLLRRSERNLHSPLPAATSVWTQLDIIRADYGTLSDETLESFRIILQGVGAKPKTAVLAQDF